MTGLEAKTKLRFILGEATAAYWTDAEVVDSLNAGQMVISRVLKPEVSPNFKTDTTPTDGVNRAFDQPADCLRIIGVLIGKIACHRVRARDFTSTEEILEDVYAYTVRLDKVEFAKVPIDGQTITFVYVKTPTLVTSGGAETLDFDDEVLTAVIWYAAHHNFAKAGRYLGKSEAALKIFKELVTILNGGEVN